MNDEMKQQVGKRLGSFFKSLTPPGVKTIPVDADEETKSRSLYLEGVSNARQLGGYVMQDGRRIKQGRLLRTANLNSATEADLRRLKEEYELSLIMDLRSDMERSQLPDQKVEGAEEVAYNLTEQGLGSVTMAAMENPVFREELFKENPEPHVLLLAFCKTPLLQDYMGNLYLNMLKKDELKETLKAVFQKIMAHRGETLLWHCTQGKDRCGMVSALFLAALGADDDTILKDFSVSNIYYEKLIDGLLQKGSAEGYDENTLLTVKAMIGVCPEYMMQALAYVNAEYGSLLEFICKELNVTKDEIEELRNCYCEG